MPRRPQHPDFWLLAQAVGDADAESKASASTEQVLAPFIDAESAIYVAGERATLIGQGIGRTVLRTSEKAMIAAAWLDGFLAGARLQSLRSAAENVDLDNGPSQPE